MNPSSKNGQKKRLGPPPGLIYPPNIYAKTDELSLSPKSLKKFGDSMPSLRVKEIREMPALAKPISIGREANLPVEIFTSKQWQARLGT